MHPSSFDPLLLSVSLPVCCLQSHLHPANPLASMDLSWLLWVFLLLVLPVIILEMNSTLKFHFKIAFYCFHCLVLSALAVPVCLIKSGGRNVDNMRIIRAFVRSMKYVYGLRYEVKGLENFQIEGPCVVISNHQSVLDMMGLMEILPDRCVAIAKKELIFAGSVGAITYLGGVIYINRKRTSDAKGVMDEVGNIMMSDNLKVWIYPEGTRNISDDLLPFKKGAFHLAVKAQVPIVQVVYSSYSSFYNRSKRLFTSGTIKVEIFPKIETTGLTAENVSELADKCYSTMRETFFRLSNKENKVNGRDQSPH